MGSKNLNIANSLIVDFHDATGNPSSNDDVTKGFQVGSKWCNVNELVLSVCTDATEGSAVWQNVAIGSSSNTLSQVPKISGLNSGTETTEYTLTIDDYDAANTYSANVSGGLWSIAGGIITWTLPSVNKDLVGNITVYSQEPGKPISNGATKFITILNFGTVQDSSLSYLGATMSQFTSFENTSIVSNELVAGSGARALSVVNNTVYDNSIEVGDNVNLDGIVYNVSDISTVYGSSPVSCLKYVGKFAPVEDSAKGVMINSDGTKMYIVLYTGVLYEYNLTTPWDVSSAVKTGFSIDLQTLSGLTWQGVWSAVLGNNNSKIYISVGATIDKLIEFSLTTPGDITTITYTANADLIMFYDFYITPTGNKIIGATSSAFLAFDLLTPWDLTSIQAQSDYYAKLSGGNGITFNNDGTVAYSTIISPYRVITYNLSSPFLMSSAVLSNIIYDFSSNMITFGNFQFNGVGDILYMYDANLNDIVQFNLAGNINGFDNIKITSTNPIKPATITTASLVTKSAISNTITQDVGESNFNGVESLIMKGSYKNLVHSSSIADKITSLDVLKTGDELIINDVNNTSKLTLGTITAGTAVSDKITEISEISSIAQQLTLSDSSNRLIGMNPDGTKMFVLYSSKIKEYDLSVAFNVTSAIFSKSYSVSRTISHADMSADGTKIYLLLIITKEIQQVNLSTPWDIGTATLGVKIVSATSGPRTIKFDTTGTKMIITGDTLPGYLYNYVLSTPWELSSASVFNTVLYTGTQINNTCFIKDGKFLLLTDSIKNTFEYELNIPYDVSQKTLISTRVSPTTFYYSRYDSYYYADSKLYILNNNILNTYTFNNIPTYSASTASVTFGQVPLAAYKQNSKVQFDFGNGYKTAISRNDTVDSITSSLVNVTSTFDDVTDPVSGTTLKTKVKLNTISDKITEISGIVTRSS